MLVGDTPQHFPCLDSYTPPVPRSSRCLHCMPSCRSSSSSSRVLVAAASPRSGDPKGASARTCALAVGQIWSPFPEPLQILYIRTDSGCCGGPNGFETSSSSVQRRRVTGDTHRLLTWQRADEAPSTQTAAPGLVGRLPDLAPHHHSTVPPTGTWLPVRGVDPMG